MIKSISKVWDDELELFSLAGAIDCNWNVNDTKCTKTKRYPTPGLLWGTINSPNIIQAIDEMIENLFSSHVSVTDFGWIKWYGMNRYAPWTQISPFMQIILGDATAVGCSILETGEKIHMFCVFSQRIERGKPVYELGFLRSMCNEDYNSRDTTNDGLSNMNPEYSGLCSRNDLARSNSESPIVQQWLNNGRNLDRSQWTISRNSEYPNDNKASFSHAANTIDDRLTRVVVVVVSFIIVKIFNP